MLAVWRPACTAGLFSFGVAGVQWWDRLHSSLGVVCREGAAWGMKQIPPCSLRSLVGMTKIFGDGRLSKLKGFWVVLARWNDEDVGFVRASCVLDRGVL